MDPPSDATECPRCGCGVPAMNALMHSIHCYSEPTMAPAYGSSKGSKRSRSPEVVDLTSSPPQRKHVHVEAVRQPIVTSVQSPRWRPYYTLALPGLPDSCNRDAITLGDIISGDLTQVFLMNYMIDFDWLLETCPKLRDSSVPVCLLHGQKNGGQTEKKQYIEAHQLFNWTCSEVDLGTERFGTHHSKAAILFYPSGVRVAVMTANYIELDFLGKTQGVFVQDFPKKASLGTPQQQHSSAFEDDLIEYLVQVRVMSALAAASFQGLIRQLRAYDFSSAQVVLIAGVPGRHSAKEGKWGHLKLARSVRAALSEEGSARAPEPSSLLMQFSSIGSMGNKGKYLAELAGSMNGGPCRSVQLVWPTVRCVAGSLQGYMAGGSLPCSAGVIADDVRNVARTLKEGFAGNLYRWEGSPAERHIATPHMKCYFKYRTVEGKNNLDWFLLTSMNLSQAAWGVLQANNTKLYIKSYELGVLFLPSRIKSRSRTFSCTPLHPSLGVDYALPPPADGAQSLQSSAGNSFLGTSIPIDIPFVVPPPQYAPSDSPWTWDIPHLSPDRFGNIYSPS